ncbi:MAG: hypothetical protein ACO2PN_20025 [Pyrobaculum sp.]|jgi:hypothetical protein
MPQAFLRSGRAHPCRSTARRRYAEGSGRRPRGAAVDKVVVAECGAGAPKRAEFHLAKRPLKEAEELLARGDYIKPPKRSRAPPR